MRIFETYASLLEEVDRLGRPARVLGAAPDGSPLVAVRTGGDRLPAVLVTAGSHSTEHAGVAAAVALIERLETDHQVWVVPCRDPVGLGGFAHALALGFGVAPEFTGYDELEELLRDGGEVAVDEEGLLVVLAGDYGYASCPPSPARPHSQWTAYNRLLALSRERPEVLAPFRGRRLYMTPGQPGVEGTGDFGRAYTLVVSPEGELLHLNRFHDTAWAPTEPRAIRQLMAEVRPGISFDLHESELMGDHFWLSARTQAVPEAQAWEERAARATIAAIAASGAVLASDDDVLGGVPLEQTWFRRSEPGVYWLDAQVRGEGLNLMDFASRQYGLAFGTEMGMHGRFAHRVNLGVLTVQTAVAVFAERYR
ncbi:MAG: hypothetical protein WDA75_19500 [Candidatus Latescibacterota bacterium]|jgi:hypothetical protein